MFKISVNTYIDTWILRIYWIYRININEYFDKNIDRIIVQNSWKCLENFYKKNDKISKNTHIKVLL